MRTGIARALAIVGLVALAGCSGEHSKAKAAGGGAASSGAAAPHGTLAPSAGAAGAVGAVGATGAAGGGGAAGRAAASGAGRPPGGPSGRRVPGGGLGGGRMPAPAAAGEPAVTVAVMVSAAGVVNAQPDTVSSHDVTFAVFNRGATTLSFTVRDEAGVRARVGSIAAGKQGDVGAHLSPGRYQLEARAGGRVTRAPFVVH